MFIGIEDQQIDLFPSGQLNDFFLDIRVDQVMLNIDTCLACVADETSQGIVQTGSKGMTSILSVAMLQDIDLRLESLAEGQGVSDAFEISDIQADGDENFLVQHGPFPCPPKKAKGVPAKTSSRMSNG